MSGRQNSPRIGEEAALDEARDAGGGTDDTDDWQKIFHGEPPAPGIVLAEGAHDQELRQFLDTLDDEDGANALDDVPEVEVCPQPATIADDEVILTRVRQKMKKKLLKKRAGGRLKEKRTAGVRQQRPRVTRRILRRRLAAYSFVQKLYLATNSRRIDFLNWSTKGKHLLLEYVALQEHLLGSRSLFSCNSVLQFTEQLLNHGFVRVLDHDLQDLPKSSIVLVFQHANFVMGAPKKIRHIRNLKPQEKLETPTLQQKQQRKDLCFSFNSYLSPLQMARCRLRTELSYHSDVALLQDHANASNRPVAKRGGRPAAILETTVEQQLVAKTDKIVNPYESVAKILTKQVPSFAGYYGNVPPPKLQDFFQEYMPRYGIKISGYKQIVIDGHNKSGDFNQNLPIGVDYSDEEKDAAADAKKDAFDLEEVMQQLCADDGSGSGSGSGSKSKPKEKPKPIKSKKKKYNKGSKSNALPESSSSSSSSEDEDEGEAASSSLELFLNENNGTYKFVKKTKEENKLPQGRGAQKTTKNRLQGVDRETGDEPLPKKSKKEAAVELLPDDNEESGQKILMSEEDEPMDFAVDDDDDDEEYIDQKVLRRTAAQPAAKRRSYDFRKSKLTLKKE
ncbi:uncharacterized protein comr [Drosophila pseudoobscura]|uniref:Uncharacterized protein comr n=1 Tax=Drosophila pseudoobscura pseudoobscura TaxID=46245 RepID=A0A6I8UVU0_DROPS|nr:uncharacterized protein LOC4805252 [Drosophila pseudoobscura]